jgi:hypothetical protein
MLLLLTACIVAKHFGWNRLGHLFGGMLFYLTFWPFVLFLIWLLLPSRFLTGTSSEPNDSDQISPVKDRD